MTDDVRAALEAASAEAEWACKRYCAYYDTGIPSEVTYDLVNTVRKCKAAIDAYLSAATKPTIDADLLDEMERTISIDGQHSDPHVPTCGPDCFICQLLARVKAAREGM